MRKKDLYAEIEMLRSAGNLWKDKCFVAEQAKRAAETDLDKTRKAEATYRELATHYKAECDVLRRTVEAYGERIDNLIDEFRSEVMVAGTSVSPLRTAPLNVT